MARWNPFRKSEKKAASTSLDILREIFGGSAVKSGVAVNWQTALQVTAVLACTRVIAEGIAQMPLKLYREKKDGGREVATGHRIHKIIHRKPNDSQTSFQWRETMLLHAALTGNAFCYKNRVRGEVVELLPLLPSQITVKRLPNWDVEYEYRHENGGKNIFKKRDVFTLAGPSWDTVAGLDMVRQAREAVGLSIATEEHGATFFGNGASPASVITSPGGQPTDEQLKAMRAAFDSVHSGAGNHNKNLFLFGGAKWESMASENDKAQFIETRRFQIEEVCRAFRVFPIMVMQADKASTFASAEQFFLAHAIHTLGPWAERLEQSIQRDLLDELDEPDLFAKLSMQGLLRADAKTRAEFYKSGITDGWMTRNEARVLEDFNPLDGLDEPLLPLNMGSGAGTLEDATP